MLGDLGAGEGLGGDLEDGRGHVDGCWLIFEGFEIQKREGITEMDGGTRSGAAVAKIKTHGRNLKKLVSTRKRGSHKKNREQWVEEGHHVVFIQISGPATSRPSSPGPGGIPPQLTAGHWT